MIFVLYFVILPQIFVNRLYLSMLEREKERAGEIEKETFHIEMS